VKGWRRVVQTNEPQKQAGVAVLISDKTDIKPKLIRRDKEDHFILIKETTHQEEMTLLAYIYIYISDVSTTLNIVGLKSTDRPPTQ
jgi:hypothetical protein